MFPSWRIARLFGINIFLHWSFWLLPLWVLWSHSQSTEMMSLWMHLLLIPALFSCVVLHELGHALMARHFGIGTRRITLSPLGGIAQLERMSQVPWEEFCIAVAGPLVNVVLAIVLGVGLLFCYAISPHVIQTSLWSFASILLMLNIVMVVFNMIPAFPMDGGRVLRAILAHSLGLLPGTRVAVVVGSVFACLMMGAAVFALGNPWLVLIALFVMWAGYQELRGLEWQEQQRLAEEAAPLWVEPAMSWPQPVVMHVTVCVWDQERGEWIVNSNNQVPNYKQISNNRYAV